MNNLDNDTLLGKAPIPRAVAAMAIPSVISSLVTVVYNMADTFFVGQTGDALQVAAVSLTNPIFILLMAFANMFGMGGSAIISVALGENNHQSVKKISSFISWASLVVGAAFAAVLLCFTAPILHLFGADASTFEFARGYTVYIAFGAPFVIWSAAASFVVRAEGASKEAMIGSMIGTIANIVLDPVFVSGLEQGAAGAAIATTIGNMLAALYYLWYFLKKSRRFSLAPKDALCGTHIAVRVCSAGFPTAIFSALMCVSTIVLNLILVAYGNAPVAAIGIVFKANMFITFLQMGLANGVQPIFGYSYGAGDIKRFADTERFTKLCCFVVGLAATALYFFFARADHRPVRGRQRRYYIRRADADRLHAVRPVHRLSVRQYELYAVGRTRPSGYRAVRAAAGSAAHSPAVSAECGFRSEWRSSRTVHHGLCHYCAVVRGLEKDSARIGAAYLIGNHTTKEVCNADLFSVCQKNIILILTLRAAARIK